MRVVFRKEQGAGRGKELHYRFIRLKDLLPGEALDLLSEPARVIDGAIDLRALSLSGEHARRAKLVVDRGEVLAILLAG